MIYRDVDHSILTYCLNYDSVLFHIVSTVQTRH
jgi:hypothetical protein